MDHGRTRPATTSGVHLESDVMVPMRDGVHLATNILYPVQDCRGRYASQGGFSKYVDEGNDGYDTIEWLARQPWCNGKIGVYGLSYAAHTQAALACLDSPHLACMW